MNTAEPAEPPVQKILGAKGQIGLIARRIRAGQYAYPVEATYTRIYEHGSSANRQQ